MTVLKGRNVYLRALEPEDLEFIYTVENDEAVWEISNTVAPYSKYFIKKYLEQAHKGIYEVKQLRLVISDYEDMAVGIIDIFDFDIVNKRASIGILVKRQERRKGHGNEALKLLIAYCFETLALHQVYCNVLEDNLASLSLFEQCGFERVGLKKDWVFCSGAYKNEHLLQLINSKNRCL